MSDQIGSATFGLVVGLGRFRRELGEAKTVAKREGEDAGEAFVDGAEEETERGGGRIASKLGDMLSTAGAAAAAAAGAAVVAGLWSAVEQEQQQDRWAASLGLSDQQAEALGARAGDIYTQAYGESLEEVQTALGAVMSTMGDIGRDEMDRATVAALNLADVFETDVATSVSYAQGLITNGLARDTDHAMDLMTTALQRAPMAMRENVLEAMDEYDTFFSQLGVSGERAFGLLVDAAADGQYAIDKSGDALKEFTIIVGSDLARATPIMEQLGLDAGAMANSILAGGEQAGAAFGQIVDGLLGIRDPAEQAQAAIGLFGAPLEDLGTENIPDFLGALRSTGEGLGDVSGAAEAMGDQLGGNAATRIEAFKRRALQGLTDFIGGTVIPGITRLADWLGPRLQPFIETGRQVLGSIVTWMREHWPQIQETVESVMTSVGDVIGSVVELVQAIWAEWGDEILAVIENVWPQIQRQIEGAMNVIKGIIETVTSLIKGDWSGVWEGIKAIFSGAWDAISGMVGQAFGALKVLVGDKLTAAKDEIVRIWNNVVDFVTGLPGRIGRAVSGMWDGIKDAFRAAINWIIDRWNGLSFTLPSVSAFGVTIGGNTIRPPQIPRLWHGGTITSAGLALVGDRGPEMLSLPAGAQVSPLDRLPDLGGTSDHRPIVVYTMLDGKVVSKVVVDNVGRDTRRRGGREPWATPRNRMAG